MAFMASVGDWIPLATRAPDQFSRRKAKSAQVRLVPAKAVRIQAIAAAGTSDSIDLPFERAWYLLWNTGSEKPI